MANKLCINFSELATAAQIEIQMPRLASRQANRTNVPASTPTEYYRRSIFIPFLDGLLSNFKTRFDGQQAVAYGLSAVIPTLLEKYDFSALEQTVELYSPFLPSDSISDIRGEYELWRRHWKATEEKPKCAIEALNCKAIEYFPNMSSLLKILAVLPVSTATAERSFSSLKVLKTYLRSTICEDRLNGLALLYIHKEVELNVDQIIGKFACQARRLPFVL